MAAAANLLCALGGVDPSDATLREQLQRMQQYAIVPEARATPNVRRFSFFCPTWFF